MPLYTDLFDPEFLGTDLALAGGDVATTDAFDLATISDVENVKAALRRRLSPETSGLSFFVRDVAGVKQIAAPTSQSLGPVMSEPLTAALPLRTKQLVVDILSEEDRIDIVNVLTALSQDPARPGILIDIYFTIRASQEGGVLSLVANRATANLEVL